MNKTMKMIAVAMAMCMACACTAEAAPKHDGKHSATMAVSAKEPGHAKVAASAKPHDVRSAKAEKHEAVPRQVSHKPHEPAPKVAHRHKPAPVHAAPPPAPKHETVCVHSGTTVHADGWCALGASLIGGLVGGLIGASL